MASLVITISACVFGFRIRLLRCPALSQFVHNCKLLCTYKLNIDWFTELICKSKTFSLPSKNKQSKKFSGLGKLIFFLQNFSRPERALKNRSVKHGYHYLGQTRIHRACRIKGKHDFFGVRRACGRSDWYFSFLGWRGFSDFFFLLFTWLVILINFKHIYQRLALHSSS